MNALTLHVFLNRYYRIIAAIPSDVARTLYDCRWMPLWLLRNKKLPANGAAAKTC